MPGEATLVFVLQTLKEEWREYRDLKYGERREFEQLEEDLDQLQAFLLDSAKTPEKTEYFKAKEAQIRNLVYELEDTIEICLAKKAAEAKAKLGTRIAKKLSFTSRMAKQVKTLREEKVKPILDYIKSAPAGKPTTPLRQDQSSAQAPVTIIHDRAEEQSSANAQNEAHTLDKIVDFEDEGTIIGYLMEPKKKLDVISVMGMPGLGKTTLARKILQDGKICSKFPLRILIGVSQKFNSRDAFLYILKELIPQGTSNPSDEELIVTVRRCLANREFLLILDDVWTTKDWEVIQKILPQENGKGKVLITSRQKEVAAQANIDRNPHEMKFLGEEKSLELLKLTVFGNTDNCPQQLEDIAKKIVRKCGGSPLAVKVIGGSLKKQFTKTRAIVCVQENWAKVFEKVNEILKEDKDKSISNVVELSYNILSGDMRVCFLYTGLFPDNHEIPTSTLTQLWIAEGFIRPREKSFEESAKEILEDLIDMNLLMAMKKNLDEVKTCVVHDLIREYCKAKATEEGLFRVIKGTNEGEIKSEVQKLRRLCLHSNPSRFLSEEQDNESRVRSFLCFLEEPFEVDVVRVSTIPFNVLRVLNCKSMKFEQFPEVSSLILLKHITLSIDNLDVLPEQISHLLNLRTLIVETGSPSITVKANIWNMIRLRRFKTKATIFLLDKNWTGRACENLQTISRLSPGSCSEALSKRAPHLKTLGIQGDIFNLFDKSSLEKLLRLKKLKIVNEFLNESANQVAVPLPTKWTFPPNLASLTLSNTHLTWIDHMPVLAAMKYLTILKLKGNAFKGVLWNAEGTGFERLQFLLIEDTELVIWKVSEAHLTSLRWLVLKKCHSLQEIPRTLETHLEKLEIEYVKESAAASAVDIESIKKQKQTQNSTWVVPFKLTIGPGCDL